MRVFFAKLSLTLFCVLSALSAFAADKITFEANSPLTVAVGEAFRVEFTLNANPDQNSFKAPSFEGFDVIAGPAESQGQSVQIINGAMSKSVSYTITYVLIPQNEGNITIGAAEIAVDGKRYRTQALPIEAVKESEGANNGAAASQSGTRRRNGASQADASGQIGKDDLLLRVVASRSSVFKGEPVHVTFTLYSRVQTVAFPEYKPPTFNGFWAQKLNTDNAAPHRETYNGKVYDALVVEEDLLYPQQSGTLTIDPALLTVQAQIVVQGNRNSDPFFGGGPDFVNVTRKVQSQRLNIEVKPLPAGAPESFSGAVGNFTMDATLPSDRIAANSAATYTIRIAGTGNLTFVQAPKLTLPASFEQYNVKTTESINPSASGISGYRQFEYPVIARAEGTFDITPVEFCYFDPARVKYMILNSRAMQIEVTPDTKAGSDSTYVVQGRGISKEEVKMLGQDIRFIKLGNPQLQPERRPLLFGVTYWTFFALILIIFGVSYRALRKRIHESQNVALLRGKRANKVAVQRFRAAKQYMEAQNRHAFYEEMLRALWGYMSDKFNIPVANLTKESVREELHKRNVPPEQAQRCIAIIGKCDEAQYSPSTETQMGEVYDEGVDILSRLEAMIK